MGVYSLGVSNLIYKRDIKVYACFNYSTKVFVNSQNIPTYIRDLNEKLEHFHSYSHFQ
jgi:hypothetical protein